MVSEQNSNGAAKEFANVEERIAKLKSENPEAWLKCLRNLSKLKIQRLKEPGFFRDKIILPEHPTLNQYMGIKLEAEKDHIKDTGAYFDAVMANLKRTLLFSHASSFRPTAAFNNFSELKAAEDKIKITQLETDFEKQECCFKIQQEGASPFYIRAKAGKGLYWGRRGDIHPTTQIANVAELRTKVEEHITIPKRQEISGFKPQLDNQP